MKQIYYMFLLLIFLFGCSKLVDDNVIPPFETPEDLVYSMVEGAIKNQETIVFERIEILLSKESPDNNCLLISPSVTRPSTL